MSFVILHDSQTSTTDETQQANKTFVVNTENVDRDRDRLSVTVTNKNESLTFRFLLDYDEDENVRLLLDFDLSDPKISTSIRAELSASFGSPILNDWSVLYVSYDEIFGRSDRLLWIRSPFVLSLYKNGKCADVITINSSERSSISVENFTLA